MWMFRCPCPPDCEVDWLPLLDSISRFLGRDLDITIAKNSLSVAIKGKDPIMSGPLCKPIKVEDSTWLLDNGELVVHLEKVNNQEWYIDSFS